MVSAESLSRLWCPLYRLIVTPCTAVESASRRSPSGEFLANRDARAGIASLASAQSELIVNETEIELEANALIARFGSLTPTSSPVGCAAPHATARFQTPSEFSRR